MAQPTSILDTGGLLGLQRGRESLPEPAGEGSQVRAGASEAGGRGRPGLPWVSSQDWE